VHTLDQILLVLGVIVAVLFSGLVFLTGKGDAMSGGSGVRTTFKGKASFDDYMSRLVLILGSAFLIIMLAMDVIAQRAPDAFK
jgi:preprotein translocase subunit SecG